jgi:short subunit dehydrogenase-like uncharacterized protein
VADATRPATLPALFEGTRVLVNCAGPFTDLGEPVVAQAVRHATHYLDTSNELGYVHRLRGYDPLARRSGAAIVPACGFEVALADCAAAVLARSFDPPDRHAGEPPPLDEVRVVYHLRGGGSSLGTRRSAVRSLATSWLAYRDGAWTPAVPCRETRQVHLDGAERPALSFPSAEVATVPGHLPVRRVTAWMTISPGARLWAPVLVPLFARLARGPVGRLAEALISRVFAPPEAGLRSEAPFTVRVEARRGEAVRTLTLRGAGVYERTAEIVAYAAVQLARPGYGRAGVLAPAAALDPAALLAQAAGWGVDVARDE